MKGVLTALLAAALAPALQAQTFAEYPVPTPDSQMLGIAAGPDGNIWFTEQLGKKIGRITPAGVIVGDSNTAGGDHAFRYQDGVMTDLGTLPGGYTSVA